MTMRIAVPAESQANENRVALIPASVKTLCRAGLAVSVEAGLGVAAHYYDADYVAAGASLVQDRQALLADGDLVLRVQSPDAEEIQALKTGAIHISYLDPYRQGELIELLLAQGVTAISMEMIPRTTRAQKMDVLSSQANLAGYFAVIIASRALDRSLPMMMTPAGTLSPARVFIIGAGVAGLQAIATAKRLGARVEAFDTRPVVAEQVRSVGGKFLEIDLGDTGETAGGYAQELGPEQLEKQRQGMKAAIGKADIVITTAQVFGRPAPRIVTQDMLEAMQPGSVVLDMAVASGGNVAGSRVDETVQINGVSILGLSNIPAQIPRDASQMYSANLCHLITEYWDEATASFNLDLSDDILKSCVITHQGKIVNEALIPMLNQVPQQQPQEDT